MSNYPEGSENDPNAPWNAKEPETIECDECDGAGFVECESCGTAEAVHCDKCNGSGEINQDSKEL